VPRSAHLLVCPRVVGRSAELATLDALLANAASGNGGAVAVVGEAGIGKSRLVRETCVRARALGLAVGVGRSRAAVTEPHGILSEALVSAARATGAPSGPQVDSHRPQLGRLVPAWSDGRSPVDTSSVGLGEAVLAAATALGPSHGTLLVIEDVHWADEETLDVLDYLADNIAGSGLGLLVTSRPDNISVAGRLQTLAGRGSITYLEPGRLDQASAREMTAACLEADTVPEDVLALVLERSAQLPLLIEDLLAALLRSGRLVQRGDAWSLEPAAEAMPTRFADLVRAQLATLDASSRHVVEAASLLGQDFDWPMLAPASGFSVHQVGESLRRAGTAQLVSEDAASSSFSFRHALTADVIRAGLPAGTRAELSERLADALARSPGGAGQPALEARLRAAAGQLDQAAQLYRRAAQLAYRRGALTAAEAHVRSGLALLPQDLAALRLLLDVLVHRGKNHQARELGADLADRVSAEARTGVRLATARACIASGDADRAREHLAAARRTQIPAEVAEIAVLDAQAALVAFDRERLVAAEHLAHRGSAAAADAGQPALLCEALEVVGRCARVRDLAAAAEAFERALDVATAHGLELWRIRALNELGTVDMFLHVDGTRLRSARDAAAAVGALALAGGAEVNLAAVYTMRGEHPEAMRAAVRAEEIGRRIHSVPLIAGGLVFRGVVATHQGCYADMRAHVRAAEEIAGDDPDVIVGTWAMCRGMAGLLREDHTSAHHAFATAASRIADLPALAISPVAGPQLLLNATRAEVDLAAVARFQAEQAHGARWSQLWGDLAQAVLLGAGGEVEAARAIVERAVSVGAPMPLFQAVGLRLVGEVAARDCWGDPRAWLTTAAATFDHFEHERPAAACRSLIRRTGARVPRARRTDAVVPATLRARGVTARELEVLDLLVERHANREIAARLFLSPRTVEKHVGSLFTKLAVTGREELIRAARDDLTRADRQQRS
jgi:DNA-binding CsgD family transcriptional regulator/tetratricopeptide (TPR) repeat protein